MAYKSLRSDGRKILLLILFIILLFGSGILLIDFVGNFFGVYIPFPGLNYIRKQTFQKKIKEAENPYLLEREELSKSKDRLALIEEQLTIKENELKLKEVDSNKKLEVLKEKEKEIEAKAKKIEEREKLFNTRKEYIRDQALKLYNMPPQDAVILLEKQSETEIVDILRAIDSYSDEIGRASTSPYLITLLSKINKDKAANVVRKLKYSSGEKDSAVDILESEKIEEPPKP